MHTCHHTEDSAGWLLPGLDLLALDGSPCELVRHVQKVTFAELFFKGQMVNISGFVVTTPSALIKLYRRKQLFPKYVKSSR